jgi:alpha-beta hydrolase superfamily lysophospholipase
VRLKNEDFSRDTAVVEAMNADPLIAHEVQPTKTMQQLVLADERLKAEMSKIQLPIFILHGTLDKAAKPEGSRVFYESVNSKDKTLRLYEGYFHDLLNDTGKEAVMNDILAWLNSHV